MRRIVLTGLTALLLLTGCGGSGETAPAPENPGKPLTKAQFVKQMDSLCQELDQGDKAYNSRLDRIDTDASQSAAFTQIGQLLDKYVPVQKEQIEKIRSLKPPASEQTFHQKYLESQDDSYALARRFRDAVRREDVAALDPLDKDVDRVKARREGLVAGHGGFKYCGDSGK